MANIGVLSCIANDETTIFSDELNHASIIDACRLSRAKVEVFAHNDTLDLESKIKSNDSKRKAIVTEGIFSMNGDMAKLDLITELSTKYGCILVVDDAHGDFVLGDESKADYGGTASYYRVEKEVDIHISSLSKGLGCFGGYVACSELVRNFLINKSRAFIFTSALPDIFCELAFQAVLLAKRGDKQTKLQKNLNYFEKKSKDYKLPGLKITKDSPIIPLVLGSEEKCLSISDSLLKKGYFVQPIRYPTVKRNEAQLRISLSAMHSFKQISELLSILDSLLNNYIS
jgi:glycine C-acetyltransferase